LSESPRKSATFNIKRELVHAYNDLRKVLERNTADEAFLRVKVPRGFLPSFFPSSHQNGLPSIKRTILTTGGQQAELITVPKLSFPSFHCTPAKPKYSAARKAKKAKSNPRPS
jgi:hypothetical protein